MDYWLNLLIFIPLAYLVGSINFAVIITKLRKRDIRKMGSGNPGTMNMLRSVGKFWGLATFAFDFFKGVAMCLIGLLYFKSGFDCYLLGLMTIIGHCFSVFNKFKGGKGVATSLGVFAVGNWIAFLVAFVLFLLYLYFCKVGFLGSLLVITGLTITCSIIEGLKDYRIIFIILAIWTIVFLKHRTNIVRLIKGKEHTMSLYTKEGNLASKEDKTKSDKND